MILSLKRLNVVELVFPHFQLGILPYCFITVLSFHVHISQSEKLLQNQV